MFFATDIPYEQVSKKGADRAKYKGQLRKIDKGDADILRFDLDEFLKECDRITKGSVYIFCGIGQIGKIFSFFENNKNYMVRLCVWHKSNPSPMNGQHFFVNATEFCVFAKKRKQTYNHTYAHNVWKFPAGRSKIHPTQKPVELFEYIIESSSNEGDLIFDPCMGSGTTALAARNLGRDYLGFELNEEYYRKACERLENE